MKKALFIAMFLLPVIGFAQTTQEQYISSLRQLLNLLLQQVSVLEQELNQVQSDQNIQTDVQSATVFGSIDNPSIPVAIDVGGNEDATTTVTLYGSDCQAINEPVLIKYSDGSLQKELFKYITQDGNGHGTSIGNFVYRSSLLSGQEDVFIVADGLEKEIDFNVVPIPTDIPVNSQGIEDWGTINTNTAVTLQEREFDRYCNVSNNITNPL